MKLVDTALAYGDGHSEQLVGQALKRAFSKVYVATKIPPLNRIWPAKRGHSDRASVPVRLRDPFHRRELAQSGCGEIYLQQFHVWTDAWTTRKSGGAPLKICGEAAKFATSAFP